MSRASAARVLCACAAALTVAAPATAQTGLPSAPSGPPPGPPVLHAGPVEAPQLSVREPFAADPLLVSGTDAYRAGEYLYQDYLFDDLGADTMPLSGARGLTEGDIAATSSGDYRYPTDGRYRGNAADLVELRIRPTAEAIVYRVTLNTVLEPDVAVVGIAIDTQASGGPEVAWPRGAGLTSPGIDRFITAWGTGGEVADLAGDSAEPLDGEAVSVDTATNQMTISVPRSILDPGRETWRHAIGVGLWDAQAEGWKRPSPGASPGPHEPASGGPSGGPGVFNLGFRFDEASHQRVIAPALSPPLGAGIWFEKGQAAQLATGSTGHYAQDIDFARLEDGAVEDPNPPGRRQARIYASPLDLPEGQSSEGFPRYGGPLQPYLLHLPAGHDPERPAPLTFALHSLGGTYTQFAVFSPRYFSYLGDERGSIVVTPHAHGTDGWYTDEAEVDFFAVWADVARNFRLDPDRTAVTGYSMGGYGSYKLAVHYPDLFASAFPVVGPPGEGTWVPGVFGPVPGGAHTLTRELLENVRWVPFLQWVAIADELVPVLGPLAQQDRFDDLGLRSRLLVFAPAEHFTLALLDRWSAARDFLGDRARTGDPWRIDYGLFPASHRPELGLVHDRAWWVSGLRAREGSAGDSTLGRVRARSRAFGIGDPATRSFAGAGADAGPPLAYLERGTEWEGEPRVEAENALEVELENLAEARIHGGRARLDGDSDLRVTVEADGEGRLRLDLALPEGAVVVRVDEGAEAARGAGASRGADEGTGAGGASASAMTGRADGVQAEEVSLDREGATFVVSAGRRAYLISPGPRPEEPEPAAAPTAAPGPDETEADPGRAAPRRPGLSRAGEAVGVLAFTGMVLWPLVLIGLALTGAGRAGGLAAERRERAERRRARLERIRALRDELP